MRKNGAKEIVAQMDVIADDLLKDGFNLHLTWVPAHAGIPRNEAADKMKKLASNTSETLNVN